MAAVPRPCIERGCTEYAYTGSRCPKHEAARERLRLARGGTGRRGSSAKWKRTRAMVLRRDDRRCTSCGVTESLEQAEGRSLTVHHVNGDARNNALKNLTTLCTRCHRTADALIRANMPKKPRTRFGAGKGE